MISSNADGLNLTNVQADSVIRDCLVQRTLDDGIAVNSTFLASVLEALSEARVVGEVTAETGDAAKVRIE